MTAWRSRRRVRHHWQRADWRSRKCADRRTSAHLHRRRPFQLEAETALTIPITVSLGIASLQRFDTAPRPYAGHCPGRPGALRRAGRNRAMAYWQLSDLAGGDARMTTAD
ncbi:hypothetical protein DSL92_04255 [Billgrantia gudaonensis]|uniref:Uncharacterized protein n=1 Tax=Billgrantia gudaonensis TaxID=376427 RepID=A0A3S0QG03_9GAMM|nr:hypothetical protein DSL92_04255 [Halomonas gudaonensis]